MNIQYNLKMICNRKTLYVVWMLLLLYCSGTAEANKRRKRELKFPKGGSFVTGAALVSFLPKGPADGFAHVLEFDLGFPFPEQFAIEKKAAQKKNWMLGKWKTKRHPNKPKKYLRGKRDLKEEQKRNLRFKIEDVIARAGFNGSSCVSRFQCELQNQSSKSSLLEELLFALFESPERIEEEECEAHSLNCPISLLHIMMHSEQISPFQVI